ncbi:MAG: hypothetical protein K5633_02125 [Paludibacteraceae bacterium]|nr:hypothetical protein [Paludibacteraceae bacterium]
METLACEPTLQNFLLVVEENEDLTVRFPNDVPDVVAICAAVKSVAHAVTEQRREVNKVNKIFLIMIMVFGYCLRVKRIKTVHARAQKRPSVARNDDIIRL